MIYFLSVAFCYAIYNVNFTAIPLSSPKIFLFLVFSIAVILNPKSRLMRITTRSAFESLLCFMPFFILAAMVGVYSIFVGGSIIVPVYGIMLILDVLFSVIVIMYILTIYSGMANVKNKFEDIIVYAGLFQAFMILSMILSPFWRELYGLFVETKEGAVAYYKFKFVGVTGYTNYIVGVTQSFIAILYAVRAIDRKTVTPRFFLLFLLLFVSALFSSRSSIIVFFIGFVFLVINYWNYKYFLKRVVLSIFLLLSFLLFIVFYLVYIDTRLINEFRLLSWALEPILNYAISGELRTASSDTISQFYFMPEMSTFLYGDWKYEMSDGSYYMSTDAGYMRLILYFGAIASVFYYLSLLSPLLAFPKVDKKCKVILSTFCMSFLFLQYKGNFMVDGYSVIKMVLMYFSISYFDTKVLRGK